MDAIEITEDIKLNTITLLYYGREYTYSLDDVSISYDEKRVRIIDNNHDICLPADVIWDFPYDMVVIHYLY